MSISIEADSTSSSSSSSVEKIELGEDLKKTFKINPKNLEWRCNECDIYCNSLSQFDVHMISQKHRMIVDEELRRVKSEEAACEDMDKVDENNNEKVFVGDGAIKVEDQNQVEDARSRPGFSITEIAQNPVAIKFNINAVKYLIPENKKIGKFEKFGFYCDTCDAYMTGQIQLVMHVRGAKHQFYHPNEIPNYKPSKVYNPSIIRDKKHATLNSESQTGIKDHNRNPSNVRSIHHPRNKQIFNHIIGTYRNNLQGQMKSPVYGTVNSPQFNDINQYQFQNQVHQMAYNFKLHPVYAYQMILNQRLKQPLGPNRTLKDEPGQQQPPIQDNNFVQYRGQYDQYMHYNHSNMMQYNPGMSTPTQFGQQKVNLNYLHAQNTPTSVFRGLNQQSPIPYMMPQNSSPPSSISHTPIKEENMFQNTFQNSFATPGGYPYYPNQNIQ